MKFSVDYDEIEYIVIVGQFESVYTFPFFSFFSPKEILDALIMLSQKTNRLLAIECFYVEHTGFEFTRSSDWLSC